MVDTNVIPYSLLDKARGPELDRVRARDAEWVAPPLWASEFRNVLVQTVRAGQLNAADVTEAWRSARKRVRDIPVDPTRALEIAFDLGLSGYDAEFAAVAEVFDVPLVTDDRRVLRACERAVSIADFAAG